MEAGAGDPKFETASATFHGQSEVATINTGHTIGLGSRDYELVEVEPGDPARARFPYDRRPGRQRFQEKFEKFKPFPYDRHDGRGYAREDEVDLEAMKRHHDHSANGHVDVEAPVAAPADD